jgi:auxin influx carrier (AUX1 LAX family)
MASNTNGSEEKPVETLVGGRYLEMEQDGDEKTVKSRLSGLLWHGGSAYDAWFSCASNQVHISSFLSIVIYSLPHANSTKNVLFLLFVLLCWGFRWHKCFLHCHIPSLN